jgi:hypothetical protein
MFINNDLEKIANCEEQLIKLLSSCIGESSVFFNDENGKLNSLYQYRKNAGFKRKSKNNARLPKVPIPSLFELRQRK